MIDRQTPLAFRIHDSAYKYRSGMMPESTKGAELKRVEYSETEGFQCWFENNIYPVNGFYDPYAQSSVDPIKRYLRNELKLTAQHPTRALAYLSPSFRKEWIQEFAEFCYMNTRPFVYEPKHWTRAVKEVYNALAVWDSRIQDAVCVILEHDRPYRYRLQDILGTLDRDALDKNPRKEIQRLIKLFEKRSGGINWGSSVRLMYYAAYIPFISEQIASVLRRIDPITIALDTTDLYNALIESHENGENRHHFLGLNHEQMLKLHATL